MDMSAIRRFWIPDVAIDIGTAAVRISTPFHPLLESPSRRDSRALAGGVIVDRETAADIVRELLQQTRKIHLGKPRAIACAPTDVSQAEREAVVEAVTAAGAAAVTVVPEPLAAAVGAGVDIASGYTHLVCDIGEGVTDCAVILGGRIIGSSAVRVGCADLRRDLQRGAGSLGVHLSAERAEEILRELHLAPADSEEPEPAFRIAGRNIRSSEMVQFLEPTLERITGTLAAFYRDLPDDAAADIIDSGILLSGGGSLIRGMKARVEAATGISVTAAADPLHAVVRGAQAMLPGIAALHG